VILYLKHYFRNKNEYYRIQKTIPREAQFILMFMSYFKLYIQKQIASKDVDIYKIQLEFYTVIVCIFLCKNLILCIVQ